jgi:hypothetical protein
MVYSVITIANKFIQISLIALVASFKNLRGSKLAVFSIKCLRTAPVGEVCCKYLDYILIGELYGLFSDNYC